MKPLISSAIFLVILGCATLKPGSDPLVVRTEQALSGADATFDFVLHVDQADRGFWRTNAPAFHNFCEYLRTPIAYGTTNVPRCVEMQLLVDDDKLAYKAAKTSTSSNVLFTALITLQNAMGQANGWSNVVTSPIHL